MPCDYSSLSKLSKKSFGSYISGDRALATVESCQAVTHCCFPLRGESGEQETSSQIQPYLLRVAASKSRWILVFVTLWFEQRIRSRALT